MTEPVRDRESREFAGRIAGLMLEKAATDVLVLDLRALSTACDYFVIGTAASEPQVKAVADHIDETMRAEGEGPWHVEGRTQRRWVLLDFVHVVAHVFHKETREYYLLERLWSDAPQEQVLPRQSATSARAGATLGQGNDEPTAWRTVDEEEGDEG